MNELDRLIRARLEAFVAELTELVKQSVLDAVSDAVGGKARSPEPARASEARDKNSDGRGQKRSAAELERLASSIAGFVAKHPGSSAIEIAGALDVTTKELVLPVKKLLSDGLLVRKGRKRGTKYYRKK
jgi:hypothetical protein